jgi:glucose-6-phosphate 1-dehydrogenase
VQIDVPETLGVDERAQFYDATGATLDMLVTHMLQVAAEVALEPPAGPGPDALQEARESVLAAFRPIDPAEVVLGQGEGYRDLEDVEDGSSTDTFVAARVWVDTDRWHGVPFLLRTGKKLAADGERVSLLLRQPDGPVSDVPGYGNVVSLSLSGAGSIDLRLVTKEPGPDLELAEATASLRIGDVPGGTPLAPYAALIQDVLVGDRSLFTSSGGLRSAWAAVQPLLESPPEVHSYAPGSWGPAAADELAGPGGWLLGQSGEGPAS